MELGIAGLLICLAIAIIAIGPLSIPQIDAWVRALLRRLSAGRGRR